MTDFDDCAQLGALHRHAMSFPEAEEGTSCVKRAYRARKKAYVYLGMKTDEYNVMVKLSDSLTKAEALQAKHPDNYQVGKAGWTTIRFALEKRPPKGLLEGWIEESFRLLAPKALVAELDEPSKPAASKKKAAKKSARRSRGPSRA